MHTYEPPLSACPELIAIVGMSCHLPDDIRSPSSLWEYICAKRCAFTTNEKYKDSNFQRFNNSAHFNPNGGRPGSLDTPHNGGYFLESDPRNFDAEFFGITPVEATWMDPQQRKVLEVCYEALEGAGVTLDSVSGSQTGVYVATFTSDFQQLVVREQAFKHPYAATGVDLGIISNRVSNAFNLQGPSLTLNTACSSSIYALHQACIALRAGDCDTALVAGSNLIMTVDQHMNTAKLGVLSQTGISHTFDESADGYARAESVGCLYITTLSTAMRRNLPIRAVIRGTAVNTNGKTDLGITLPSGEGQARVIGKAYTQAGRLNPHLTGYFECHGTGTPVGDPIEVKAVSAAMNAAERGDDPLVIGAVKPNFGHSEAASGITAVIKVVMAVEKGSIPPTTGVTRLNQKIPWKDLNVRIANQVEPWPAHLAVRRASVNSFGYGGTNAHVIIESLQSVFPYQFPHQLSLTYESEDRLRLMVFSARSAVALKNSMTNFWEAAVKKGLSHSDLAYTLAFKKTAFEPPHRAFVLASNECASRHSPQELEELAVRGGSTEQRRMIWVFTGQGAQWPAMGKELLGSFPEFKGFVRELDGMLAVLVNKPDWTIEETLSQPTKLINNVDRSQTCCTAVQLMLIRVLTSWGIKPSVVVGHSSGEIAAAYASGRISTRDAIVSAYLRGFVVKSNCKPGAMLAAGVGADQARKYMEGIPGIVVACHNSPQSVTISGDISGIEKLQEILKERNIFERRLETSNSAYHSPHMTECAETYKKLMIAEIYGARNSDGLPEQKVPWVSSLTGQFIGEDELVNWSEYWCQNMVNPVLFNQAFATAAKHEKCNEMVELGPHSALAAPIRQILSAEKLKLYYNPTIVRSRKASQSSAFQNLLILAGRLWLYAYPVKLGRVNGGVLGKEAPGKMVVDLPAYPWKYEKMYWAESRIMKENRFWKHGRHDILGGLIPGVMPDEPVWRNILRAKDLPWISHHKVGPDPIFPAAGYWAMAIEAVRQVTESHGQQTSGVTLKDVKITSSLSILENENGTETLLSLRSRGGGSPWYDFRIVSVTNDASTEHCTGSIRTSLEEVKLQEPPFLRMKSSARYWYEAQKAVGFDYGSAFQLLSGIRTSPDTYAATASLRATDKAVVPVVGESRYLLHPTTLDCLLQLIQIAIPAGNAENMPWAYIPVSVDEVTISSYDGSNEDEVEGQAYASIIGTSGGNARSRVADAQLSSLKGNVHLKGVGLVSYEAGLPPKSIEDGLIKKKSVPYWKESWIPDAKFLHPNVLHIGEGIAGEKKHLEDILEEVLLNRPTIKILLTSPRKTARIGNIKRLIEEYPQSQWDTTIVAGGDPEANWDYDNLKTIKLKPFEDRPYEVAVMLGLDESVDAEQLQLQKELAAGLIPNGLLFLEKTEEYTLKLSSDYSRKFEDAEFMVARNTGCYLNGVLHTDGKPCLVYRSSPGPLLESLKNSLHNMDLPVDGDLSQLVPLVEVSSRDMSDSLVMMSLDGEHKNRSFLTSMTDVELESLQHLLRCGARIVWLTHGGILNSENAESSLAAGLARSAIAESPALNLTIVDMSKEPTEKEIELVWNLAQQKSKEREYAIYNNTIYINRVVPLRTAVSGDENSFRHQFSADSNRKLELRWQRNSNGKLEPCFQEIERGSSVPSDKELEVIIKSIAVTDQEVEAIAKSSSPYTTNCGRQFSGTVSAVGTGVPDFSIGDIICGYLEPEAVMSTVVRIPAKNCARVEGVTFSEAACMPVAYATALHCVESLMKLKKGETLVVLPDTGSVGRAVVEVAASMGVKIIGIAKDQAEEEFLNKHRAEIFKEDDLPSSDAVLATAKSPYVLNAWSKISAWGRFVCINAGSNNEIPADIQPFRRGASYGSLNVETVIFHPEFFLQRTMTKVRQLLGRNWKVPYPTIYPLGSIDGALAYRSASIVSSHRVLSVELESTVRLLSNSSGKAKFSPDASYLLVGCLGGLGRMLARWMVASGARNLVFVSRSGGSGSDARLMISELSSLANITVARADATILSDLVNVLANVPPQFPVKGVINAAMVLADGMFDNMSLKAFNKSLAPKVTASQNLHRLFSTPGELDFFIMTSSISGLLGTPGQANYAAGNKYIDTLARKRGKMGLQATSIVLPMLLDMGHVADHPEIEADLRRKGLYGIHEQEILAAFETVLDLPQNENLIIVGMDPAKLTATEGSFWMENPRLAVMSTRMQVKQSGGSRGGTGGKVELHEALASASPEEGIQLLTSELGGLLSRMLLLDDGAISTAPDKSIAQWGVDSMIGGELRSWVFKTTGQNIAIQKLLARDMSISKLSTALITGDWGGN